MTRALEYRAARPGVPLSELKIGDQLYLERVPKGDGSGEYLLLPTRRTHFNIVKPFITGFKHIGRTGGADWWEIRTSAGTVIANSRRRYHKAS